LLTYTCTFECDHCFLYSSPSAGGTFTIGQIRRVLAEANRLGSISEVYFEGGEPFMFYPLLIEGIRAAHQMGFEVGVVTNAYGALTAEDATLWLRPLAEAGLDTLSVSDDSFHYGDKENTSAKAALEAAGRLGLPASSIAIVEPDSPEKKTCPEKGRPVEGGKVMFRGRAAEKLTAGLPRKPAAELVVCPYEDLDSPSRVHVDAYGNVHLCQGLIMGNMWQTPLADLVKRYDPARHPICGPLIQGGPARLAAYYDIEPEDEYVEECHFCYSLRSLLRTRFLEYLAPAQVYGLD